MRKRAEIGDDSKVYIRAGGKTSPMKNCKPCPVGKKRDGEQGGDVYSGLLSSYKKED